MLSKYAAGLTAASLIALCITTARPVSAEVIFQDNFAAGTGGSSTYSSASASTTGLNYDYANSEAGGAVTSAWNQFTTSGDPSVDNGLYNTGTGDSGGGLQANLIGLGATGLQNTSFDFTIVSTGSRFLDIGFDNSAAVTSTNFAATYNGTGTQPGVDFLIYDNGTGDVEVRNDGSDPTLTGIATTGANTFDYIQNFNSVETDGIAADSYEAFINGVEFSSGAVGDAVGGADYLSLGSHNQQGADTISNLIVSDQVSAAPEPSQAGMIALMVFGLCGLILRARKRLAGGSLAL